MNCPKCGGPLECLGGCSAHPLNWYCSDERNCGYQAWNPNNVPTPQTQEDSDDHR